MHPFKLLLVEDSESDKQACRDSLEIYVKTTGRGIHLVEATTAEEALRNISTVDGAIIDLKLAQEGDEGNQIVKEIIDGHLRIPFAVLTGTPISAVSDFHYFGVFKKGEIKYSDLFDRFWGVHASGVTRILGGRGVIEDVLDQIFRKYFLPWKDVWMTHGINNTVTTESALLRYILRHLIEILDQNVEVALSEEVYFSPPLRKELRIGSIVQPKIDSSQNWIVLSPACDLEVRSGGGINTDQILLVQIEPLADVFPWCNEENLSGTRKGNLKSLYTNRHTLYYHWLPSALGFGGGAVNFRKLVSIPVAEFPNKYEGAKFQLTGEFIKDMASRFSSYYGRQGQPELIAYSH